MPKWRARIRFAADRKHDGDVGSSVRIQTAEILLDADDEKHVRRQLAAMGVASEALPVRVAVIGRGHDEMLYPDEVIDVATESIDAVYDPISDTSWAKPPHRSRSVRAVLAARKRIKQRSK